MHTLQTARPNVAAHVWECLSQVIAVSVRLETWCLLAAKLKLHKAASHWQKKQTAKMRHLSPRCRVCACMVSIMLVLNCLLRPRWSWANFSWKMGGLVHEEFSFSCDQFGTFSFPILFWAFCYITAFVCICRVKGEVLLSWSQSWLWKLLMGMYVKFRSLPGFSESRWNRELASEWRLEQICTKQCVCMCLPLCLSRHKPSKPVCVRLLI